MLVIDAESDNILDIVSYNWDDSRFHEYKIISCGKKIDVIAKAQDNSIEAFLMKENKIAGIIWHPERTKNNLKNQTNFFRKIYAVINSSIR